jgi:hypothetical protein
MAADKFTRITIEREQILIIARPNASRGWCKQCGVEVEFVAREQVRSFLDPLPEHSGGWQKNKIHLAQAKDGLAVCMKSLLRFLQAASGKP